MAVTSPIVVDPDELKQIAVDYLQAQIPGWEPIPGAFGTRLLSAIALIAAETATIASDVPDAIARYVGQTVYNVPPIDATAASVPSTWTMVDNAGYTIPAGTQVALTAADGTLVTFTVQADVTVPAASTVTAAGEVVLVAAEPSLDGSSLGGTVTLLDPLAFVQSAVCVGSSTGGLDAETDSAYVERITQIAPLFALRPILPDDFARCARLLTTGVARALALDGYEPVGPSSGNERCVTVAVCDTAGAACPGPVKTAVDAVLQAHREATFSVYVIDPTFTTINVTVAGKAAAGYDTADVQARVQQALTDLLNPATWGIGTEAGSWVQTTKVRYQDVVTAINTVDGFDYYTTLTVNSGTSDVTMSGAAPLPTPGTLSVTIT